MADNVHRKVSKTPPQWVRLNSKSPRPINDCPHDAYNKKWSKLPQPKCDRRLIAPTRCTRPKRVDTLKSLGLDVPATVLARADEVIE